MLASTLILVLLMTETLSARQLIAQPAPEFDMTPVESAMRGIIAAGDAPSLSAAAVADGKIIWAHAEGFADSEAKIAATPDTIYRIGSVSKSISATALGLADQDGLISLESRLCVPVMLSPELSCTGITMADAINMAATMPQSVYYPGIAPDGPAIAPDSLVAQFGFSVSGADRDTYAYSNLGPAWAADALTEKTGQGFNTFLTDRLLAPARMTATFAAMRDAPQALRAASYNRKMERFASDYEALPFAAAGMVSSARDLAIFSLLHLGAEPGLVDHNLLATLHTPATGGFYGYGWGRIVHEGRTFLISDGQVNGGEAIIILEPERGTAAIVLSNSGAGQVARIALLIMETLEPGAASAFEAGVQEIEARLTPPSAAENPVPQPLIGTIRVAGAYRRITLAMRSDGALGIGIGESALRAQPADADGPYAHWTMPCPVLLPACTANADAELFLRADELGTSGYISVTSIHGQFAYGVSF